MARPASPLNVVNARVVDCRHLAPRHSLPGSDLGVDDAGEASVPEKSRLIDPARPLFSIADAFAERVAPLRSFVLVVGAEPLSDGLHRL